MPISMYAALIPSCKHMLNNLSRLLDKAAAYADTRKIDSSVLVNARLFPDMFPLTRQVQIAGDIAKSGAARLAGIEVPKFDDNEATFSDLQARIAKTIRFLETIQPEQIDGSEERDIVFQIGERKFEFKGRQYLSNWVLPNFYFHITTAYNILRHNGVEIGKGDFLGG